MRREMKGGIALGVSLLSAGMAYQFGLKQFLRTRRMHRTEAEVGELLKKRQANIEKGKESNLDMKS
jgi:triphosphoribosyl-dephospho-CoA synthetase